MYDCVAYVYACVDEVSSEYVVCLKEDLHIKRREPLYLMGEVKAHIMCLILYYDWTDRISQLILLMRYVCLS